MTAKSAAAAIEQGKFTEQQFIKPYQHILEQWSAHYAL